MAVRHSWSSDVARRSLCWLRAGDRWTWRSNLGWSGAACGGGRRRCGRGPAGGGGAGGKWAAAQAGRAPATTVGANVVARCASGGILDRLVDLSAHCGRVAAALWGQLSCGSCGPVTAFLGLESATTPAPGSRTRSCGRAAMAADDLGAREKTPAVEGHAGVYRRERPAAGAAVAAHVESSRTNPRVITTHAPPREGFRDCSLS